MTLGFDKLFWSSWGWNGGHHYLKLGGAKVTFENWESKYSLDKLKTRVAMKCNGKWADYYDSSLLNTICEKPGH